MAKSFKLVAAKRGKIFWCGAALMDSGWPGGAEAAAGVREGLRAA